MLASALVVLISKVVYCMQTDSIYPAFEIAGRVILISLVEYFQPYVLDKVQNIILRYD